MARKLQDIAKEPLVESNESKVVRLGTIIKQESPFLLTPTVINPSFQQPIVAVGREGLSPVIGTN